MQKSVCWIDNVDYQNADQSLKTIYDRVLSPGGNLDNLYLGFSLSPQTIMPADDLYRATLHDKNNVLAKSFSELVGTYVAILAGCGYAKAHHGHNFIQLSADSQQAQRSLDALESDSIESSERSDSEIAALLYVRKLCLQPADIVQSDIDILRSAGWSDTEISELVQVVSMFSYFVRVINGVGIQLGDEKLGLY